MFIYDDKFLTEEEICEVDEMYWSTGIPWAYLNIIHNNGLDHPGIINTGAKDISYFTFTVNENEERKESIIAKKIVNIFCNKHNISFDSISRIKFNLTPSIKNATTLFPHVDASIPHWVFLYYVNDSDGDTVLYKQRLTGSQIDTPGEIMERITPKRGSAFLLDGRHFHAITPPENTRLRGVININLNIKNWID